MDRIKLCMVNNPNIPPNVKVVPNKKAKVENQQKQQQQPELKNEAPTPTPAPTPTSPTRKITYINPDKNPHPDKNTEKITYINPNIHNKNKNNNAPNPDSEDLTNPIVPTEL